MISPVYRRRSIRKYKDKLIPDELVKDLVHAGLSAPSARNKQPWQFIVINDRKKLDELGDFHPYGKMLKQAPLAILVCGDTSLDDNIGYLALNCAAATENILIRVTELGLGAVWLGVYPREKRLEGLKPILNLPDNVIPMSLIPIGFPDEEKAPHEDLDWGKVKFNMWT